MRILLTAVVVLLAINSASAGSIFIGTTEFELGENAFPYLVTQEAGPTNSYAGILGTDGLTGHDLDTGAFNLDSGDIFELNFPVPIVNQVGADIYFTDSRFSTDALDIDISLGGSYYTIQASAFTDTGVDSVIRNTNLGFDLFAAEIDMSDFGFALGESISVLRIRGVSQSDPIVIGNLNSANVVPLPGAVWLGLGLLGTLGAVRRLRRR